MKKRELERKKEAEREGLDPDEFGNLSSIMINPNEISNAIYGSNVLGSVRGSGAPFNFAKELEIDDKKRGNT